MKKIWKYLIALACIATVCVSCQKDDPQTGDKGKTVDPTPVETKATLKEFAQQFVTYLDVWERTTGTLSADGSHCSANNTAWKDVHFIPIPYSGGDYPDGKDQYAQKYQPYPTITVKGKEYTAVQAYIVAVKGFLDLVTKEGSSVVQKERNTPVHTPGNGKSLTDEIPEFDASFGWGKYPWYEQDNVYNAINFSDEVPCNIEFMTKGFAWGVGKATQLGYLGNYLTFGSDPNTTLVLSPYTGKCCVMRAFLIMGRFYKYLLDNNITTNVYDAVKNVNFDYDLYGIKEPDIALETESLEFEADGGERTLTFSAKSAWTAETTASWITISPASGNASETATITVKAHSNYESHRTGAIILKGGNVTDGIQAEVVQKEYVVPLNVTARDFAIEFVKCLTVWENTVGTVDADGMHTTTNGNAWKNVHFIPIGETVGNPYGTSGNQFDPKYTPWTLSFGTNTYDSAQAWEVACRLFLNLVTKEGEEGLASMKRRNSLLTYGDAGSFSDKIPVYTSGCRWGTYPWYESDNNDNSLVVYKGKKIETVGINFLVRAVSVHVARAFVANGWVAKPRGYIGNYQEFGTDTSGTIVEDGYEGFISPMRELIILARVYKYMLDNDINDNVYTALKDVQFDFDMYHQEKNE